MPCQPSRPIQKSLLLLDIQGHMVRAHLGWEMLAACATNKPPWRNLLCLPGYWRKSLPACRAFRAIAARMVWLALQDLDVRGGQVVSSSTVFDHLSSASTCSNCHGAHERVELVLVTQCLLSYFQARSAGPVTALGLLELRWPHLKLIQKQQAGPVHHFQCTGL